jgi:hypothetical protein
MIVNITTFSYSKNNKNKYKYSKTKQERKYLNGMARKVEGGIYANVI